MRPAALCWFHLVPSDLSWASWLHRAAQWRQCGCWLLIDEALWLLLSDLLNPSILSLISSNTGPVQPLRYSPCQSHTDCPYSSQECHKEQQRAVWGAINQMWLHCKKKKSQHSAFGCSLYTEFAFLFHNVLFWVPREFLEYHHQALLLLITPCSHYPVRLCLLCKCLIKFMSYICLLSSPSFLVLFMLLLFYMSGNVFF